MVIFLDVNNTLVRRPHVNADGAKKKLGFFAPKVRTKGESECQISVFLVSETKIQGFIVI